ncbi:ATP-binding cassette domain-containing protein [Lachnoclostridium sp.]|uniref:ATP-binding cassette domain-containing protein n=1 Tax=Lachnoclostridium sp. TaxID=2028282 RepID=UPI002896824D|nr:ATP-binding cassette domain-containing protein [Lachnoclostridium sp.]
MYNYAWEENFIGVELFGVDCNKQKELFSRIGVLIEAPGLFPNMTAFENLKMKCISLGIKDDNYIHEIIELVGLKGVDKKKTKNYSFGMKQRLLYWKMKKAGIK